MLARTPVAAAYACFSIVGATPFQKRQNDTSMIYNFRDLSATDDLVWRSCFDGFTCTKLRVPLDYEDKSAGTTHVSFIKWSSNATSNATQDILLNPGGPGGSGISDLILGLDLYLEALGTNNNLISFDPRGVNNSGPDVSCFGDQEGTLRLYDPDYLLPLDVDDIKTYRRAFSYSAAWGDFCTKAHSGPNSTAKYVNTIATATDMLHYTELLAQSRGQDPLKSELWYYGISYGTVLGTTFASLFPDRVGRMIVDGVVDGEDYYRGGWEANLPDADKAVEFFFQSCFEGGKSACKSWEASPAAIKTRFEAAVISLTEDPIPYSDNSRPGIITVDGFKGLLQVSVYNPVGFFEFLDRGIIAIEERDPSNLFTFGGPVSGSCSDSEAWMYPDFEPRYFIACTDANNRTDLSTFVAWESLANQVVNQSAYLGELWAAGSAIMCRNLNIQAPPSQIFKGYPTANTTRNPLLFASTRIDPVTPLRAAEKMHARFGGAGLLVQESVGHATSSTPSKCTHDYFKAYFKDASLPPEGTTCEPDILPFQGSGGLSGDAVKRALQKRRIPNIGH